MRGQVSTWLGLENGAGQGTLHGPHPHSPSLLSGVQERVAVILGFPAAIEPWGSSKVPSKNVELAETELPLRAELGNDTCTSACRLAEALHEATGPRD